MTRRVSPTDRRTFAWSFIRSSGIVVMNSKRTLVVHTETILILGPSLHVESFYSKEKICGAIFDDVLKCTVVRKAVE